MQLSGLHCICHLCASVICANVQNDSGINSPSSAEEVCKQVAVIGTGGIPFAGPKSPMNIPRYVSCSATYTYQR